jgi:hypothetical protein
MWLREGFYIDLINSVIASYLDKSLSAEKRLEEIWYANFFVRYWREWITLQPSFSLSKNFLTTNAYMCIEISAHSLLAFLLILRSIPEHNDCFTPWLLGSQSCEKSFRSLRSMTGTFSTIINFTMFGLLQRLHKLAIKEDLQSQYETSKHGMIFRYPFSCYV